MPDEAGAVPARRTGPFPCSAADEQGRADSRARRLALYGEVQRRRAAGEPLISIARTMKLARGTVRNYAHASSFPERAARRPGHSTIDRHLPHLQDKPVSSMAASGAEYKPNFAGGVCYITIRGSAPRLRG